MYLIDHVPFHPEFFQHGGDILIPLVTAAYFHPGVELKKCCVKRSGHTQESAGLVAGCRRRYCVGMRVSSVEAVFRSLNSGGVKYLVVGGLAVNAHGYGRVTFGIDLVVALERENVKRVFQALADLEFRPLAPVSAVDFSDRDIRDRLRREKGMMVLEFLYLGGRPKGPTGGLSKSQFPGKAASHRRLVQDFPVPALVAGRTGAPDTVFGDEGAVRTR